jgi:L-aspartate oxidase
LGQVYSKTTNPPVATGDGVATAWRAGAEISDIEFVQFHPTALNVAGAPTFLLTEALRGEGAHLLNADMERFMTRYHDMAELAPRDVVSRSIVAEMERTRGPVFLGVAHLGSEFIRGRFPQVCETCLSHGIDLTAGPVPVSPAAHYAMGGVRSDLWGRTSLGRLYAAGEAACNGVHGANRLASNSLLEGVVFGSRAGRAMQGVERAPRGRGEVPSPVQYPDMTAETVRELAWRYCGISRSADGLSEALRTLGAVRMTGKTGSTRRDHQLRNIHAVATLIARCATAREESRGAHYRMDFRDARPEFQSHSRVRKDNPKISFM